MRGVRRNLAALAFAAAIVTSGFAQQMGAPRDVPPGHWAHAAVESLFREGILHGYPDGSFRGGAPVVRYQLAALDTVGLAFASLPALPVASQDALAPIRESLARLQADAAELKSQLQELPELLERMSRLQQQLRELRRTIDGMKGRAGTS